MSNEVRKNWIDIMLRIAEPVLVNLSEERLKEELPMTFHPDRAEYAHLEALGRTLLGLAPWLELEDTPGEEKALQEKYRELSRRAISNAVNPESPDYMNFSEGYGQALVDAAFLAHAIVRAPKQLYELCDEKTKKNIVEALKTTRKFTPCVSNWLFFSAMIETCLFKLGEDYDRTRIEYAIRSFESWYVGDGTYGDGPAFHWDYYNSFVIHPMYVDIMKLMAPLSQEYKEIYEKVVVRAARFAQIQEQLINADGSYPVFGRSTTYRFGAFQALAQACLQEYLPKELAYAQVRCALDALINRIVAYEDMFDDKGWLTPGVCGYQPDLAEHYICVGSLYLCTAVFLPLGLPEGHSFWRDEDMDWTAKKIWSGKNVVRDHALD